MIYMGLRITKEKVKTKRGRDVFRVREERRKSEGRR
jgi:hypothetical protein